MMDFNLKKWREEEQQKQQKSEEQQPSAKIPRLMLLESPHPQEAATVALPLFVSSESLNSSNININNKITTQFPSYSDHSSTPAAIPTSSPRFPRVGGRYCFSIAQWQELEVQVLIYKHISAGVAVPSQLLHLVNSFFSSSSTSPYYLHHFSPHFHHHALMQGGGYWGKGTMDPEPGRCRRTDGKKWRCSRDIVAGHKYCERHLHRGRNRSRKPVEFPPPDSASNVVGSLNKSATGSSGGGGGTPWSVSGSARVQFNQRSSSESCHGNEQQSVSVGGERSRVLMRFFDDWPRSVQHSDNGESNSGGTPSSTSLSMWTQTTDFLRLSTGNDEDEAGVGGPLGEALRSSTNTASHSHHRSPTSVLLLH